MHHLRPPSLLVAVLAAVAAVAVPAQTGNTEVRPDQKPGKVEQEQQKGVLTIEEKTNIDGDAAAEGAEADGRMVMNPAMLANYAFPHVTTRPRRLAPGESGTLVIVLALGVPAVVPGGTAVALEYEPKQGSLTLGSYAVQPPSVGTLDTKYKGQPVYDNTLTIELPVTVGRDAQRGEAPVALNLRTTLYNGSDGQAMGELQLPISGRVSIGKPLPKPFAQPAGGGSTVGDDGTMTPTAAPERARDAEPTLDAAPAAGGAARARISGVADDGVAFDVVFVDGNALAPGATIQADVTVRVPDGFLVSRATPEAFALEVTGADDGVAATVAPLPRPTHESEANIPVTRGSFTVPVTFSAAEDAAPGLRNLDFRLTYAVVGSDGVVGPTQTLSVPAVLSVGTDATAPMPWLWVAAGGTLLLVTVLFLGRSLRK